MMKWLMRFVLLSLLTLTSLLTQAATTINTPADLYFPTVNTVAGNPDGKITVVEFFDYCCIYCRRMPAILAELIKQHPDVRVVYRDYPILGPQSTVAAEAALSAQQQGKYIAMHNALFAVNKPLDINVIKQLATQVGLNETEMEKDHLSYLTQQQLRENAQFASKLGVTGIPSFFVAFTPMSTQHDSVEAYQLISPKLDDLQNIINLLKEPA